MKGNYTCAAMNDAHSGAEDHPQMKGNYTNAPLAEHHRTAEDHPQMKGNYTGGARRRAADARKTIPK